MRAHSKWQVALLIAVATGLAVTGGCKKSRGRTRATATLHSSDDFVVHRVAGTSTSASLGMADDGVVVAIYAGDLGGQFVKVGDDAHDALRTGRKVEAVRSGEAAADNASPLLERVHEVMSHAARGRSDEVLSELTHIAESGELLSTDAMEFLVNAVEAVGTPRAASHVRYSLARRVGLENAHGKLIREHDTILHVREIEELPTSVTVVPPATDLTEREIYLDSRLRVGQEGLLPDLGGQAAQWQQRPSVQVSELRHQPGGPLSDQLIETSTSTTFDYIPPRATRRAGDVLPPVVIRLAHHHRCKDGQSAYRSGGDC